MEEASARARLFARQIEKDYWVTEILRIIVAEMRGQFLFKGGTSLSKAYQLIRRFSEDIDILLLTDSGEATDAALDHIADIARRVTGSEPEVFSRTPGLAAVFDVKFPKANLAKTKGMRRDIRIEPGVRGGPLPCEQRMVRGMWAEIVPEGDFDELAAFEVDVLHPARTLIEKLFAMQALWEKATADPDYKIKTTVARHVYDLYYLCDQSRCEAIDWLSKEDRVQVVAKDCEEISNLWYGQATLRPDVGFADGPAYRDGEFLARLAPSYDLVLRDLAYNDGNRQPTMEEAVAAIRTHGGLL